MADLVSLTSSVSPEQPIELLPGTVSDPILIRIENNALMDEPANFLAGWQFLLQIVPDVNSQGSLAFHSPVTGTVTEHPSDYVFDNTSSFGVNVENNGELLFAYDFNFPFSGGVQVPFETGATLLELELSATSDASGGFGIYAIGASSEWSSASIESREFENLPADRDPVLIGQFRVNKEAPALLAGDADRDLDFDQLDLVQVLDANLYLTGQPATWGEGDWDGAPGGTPNMPPVGNGRFDQRDVIAALAAGTFLKGPYAAVAVTPATDGFAQDRASIRYHAETGQVDVQVPDSTELTSIRLQSESGIFVGDSASGLTGPLDVDTDHALFKSSFGGRFGSLSLGSVAQPNLSEEFLLQDLTIDGTLAPRGNLGDVGIVYLPVPEPRSILMLLTIGWIVLVRRNARALTPKLRLRSAECRN